MAIQGQFLDTENIADEAITTAKVADANITNVKLGTDISAAKLTAGTVATARMGSGSATSSTFLRGDGTWNTPVAGGAGNTSRNYIINGAMEVAQRGTSETSGAFAWLLDRFYTFTYAAAGRTVSQTTNAPTGFKHSLKIARDSGIATTTQTHFSQPLESAACVGTAGETVTLSFWARCGANFSPTSSYINVALYSGTGTDQTLMAGLTGGVAVIGTTNQALTTSWVRYEFTSGSVVPTDSNQLVLQIINVPTGTAGADDWYEITGIQIEIRDAATEYAHESFGDTLDKCKRYYQKSFDYDYTPANASYTLGFSEAGGLVGTVTSATEYRTISYFEPPLRVDPTIVYYRAQGGGLSDGEWAYWDGADNLDTNAVPTAAITTIRLVTKVPFSSGGKTTGRSGTTQGNWTAASELFPE